MKTVLASVFSAVVAGIILFIAQDWWSENQKSARQSIRFDQISSLDLNKSQLQDLLKKSNDYQSTVISIYKSKNVGKDDIAESSFSGPISDAIGFGSISYPNGNPKNAEISFDGKVVSVKYKLLPSDAEHTFWIASYAPALGVDFSNDSKGTHVLSMSDKIEEQDPFPWGFLGIMAIGIVALLIGIGIGVSWLSAELKKRGIDTDVTPNLHPVAIRASASLLRESAGEARGCVA